MECHKCGVVRSPPDIKRLKITVAGENYVLPEQAEHKEPEIETEDEPPNPFKWKKADDKSSEDVPKASSKDRSSTAEPASDDSSSFCPMPSHLHLTRHRQARQEEGLPKVGTSPAPDVDANRDNSSLPKTEAASDSAESSLLKTVVDACSKTGASSSVV